MNTSTQAKILTAKIKLAYDNNLIDAEEYFKQLDKLKNPLTDFSHQIKMLDKLLDKL